MKDDGSINNPNVTNTSQAYWEKVLKGHDLSMSRGRTVRDDYAEAAYCYAMADHLAEEGQVLPIVTEVQGCEIVVEGSEDYLDDTDSDE